jgi:capsular exopolysaccharide synthesis family protein
MTSGRTHVLPRIEPGPPAPAAQPEPSLRDLVGVLMRQRLLIAACVVVCVGAGVAYTLLSRPVYEATSAVGFEAERVDVPQLVQAVYSDNVISTEMEVLRGRTAAVNVIDSLGLRARLVAPRSGRVTALFSTLRPSPSADSGTFVFTARGDSMFAVSRLKSTESLGVARIGDTTRIAGVLIALSPAARALPGLTLRVDLMEEAIKRFESAVKVSRPARDADLLDIQVRTNDPAQSAAIANLMATNLIADRQAARRGSTSAAAIFLQQQGDSLGRQLRTSEDSLRAYQEREHVIDVPQQASAEVARLAKMQADLAGVRAERDAFMELVDQLRQDTSAGSSAGHDAARRLMAFPSLLSNQSAAVLLGGLAQAENERSQLLIRRMPADSDVQVLTHRIRDIEAQLQGIAESYLQSLSNQVGSLAGEASKFRTQLDALPKKELHTARLERDTKVLNDLWVLVQTRLKEAQVTGAGTSAAVRIVDAAAASNEPIRPKPLLNLALSLLLGTMVGVTASLTREMNDRSVRSRSDALAAGGLPVLGAFPRVRRRRHVAPLMLGSGHAWTKDSDRSVPPERDRTAESIASLLITRPGNSPAYAESFNQLFANLAFASEGRPLKVIAFTSPLPGEGKTLSAINFALAGVARGLRVLLVDADLRCGVVSTALGIDRVPGFSEMLVGTASAAEAVRRVARDEAGSLVVIPSGALPKDPARLLTVERIRDVLALMVPKVDLVVIDTPPVNLLADAGMLGAAADAVLLVVRAGHTQADDLRYAMEQLEAMRAPVIGTLLNDIDVRRNSRDDGSYRYLAEAGRYHVSAS